MPPNLPPNTTTEFVPKNEFLNYASNVNLILGGIILVLFIGFVSIFFQSLTLFQDTLDKKEASYRTLESKINLLLIEIGRTVPNSTVSQ